MVDNDARRAADEQNFAAFREVLPAILKTYTGSFALMREGRIVQFFSTEVDALDYGHQMFEDDLFSTIEVSDRAFDRDLPEAPSPGPAAPEPTAPAASEERAAPPGPEAVADHAMRVIVFASQKGGAGKTTLCGQLAVQAELAGAGPVALIDTDPQGSLAEWWNSREVETPLFVKTHFANLTEDLSQLGAQGINLVFVDTPPAVTDTIREVVGSGDLVVIPTRPSPHDLRAVGATVDIIENQRKPLIFAVNAATVRARITSDAAVALSQHGTVAPVTVHQRVDFATSMINGQTVMEMNAKSRSAEEIRGLWEYIAGRLEKVERQRPERRVVEHREEDRPFDGPDRRQADREGGFGRRPAVRTFGRRVSE